MPIGSNPNQTVPAWLKIDEQIPQGQRPTFHLRFLSESNKRKVEALLEQAGKEADGLPLLEQVLALGVAGFSNMTHHGEPVKPGTPFADFLTSSEMWELAYLVQFKPQLDELDKKKSSLPSTSPRESSAAVA